MAMIHVNRGATSLGVFSEEEVREGLRTGRFAPSDIGWGEGMANWQPLSQFPELAAAAPTAPPPQTGAISATGPSPGAPAVKTEPLAIWSFVLSLLGLVCCGFVLGIPGVICGHLALSKLQKEPQLQGKGLATAGLIIGYVAIACWLIYVALFGTGFLHGLTESMSKH
jgi:uncharacterized protein DUF4190/uncharacterized protein DUF4339